MRPEFPGHSGTILPQSKEESMEIKKLDISQVFTEVDFKDLPTHEDFLPDPTLNTRGTHSQYHISKITYQPPKQNP